MAHAMNTHRFLYRRPASPLADLVRFYVHREACLGGETVIHPVPARATAMLEFVLADPVEAHWCNRARVESATLPQLIGLQTYRRVKLIMRGTIESFVICFQPAGLSRLFGLSLDALTNHDFEAHAVLGPSMSQLSECLGNARSFDDRAGIADAFLSQIRTRPADGIALAAAVILRQHGTVRIAKLADLTGLSLRQFERRFVQQVGVRPKLYARIARFEAALDFKARSEISWTEIAHEFGYHDQMHLVHDFEEFSGETPTGILTEVHKAYGAVTEPLRFLL
jgi:AraC-like DNA-binding protein